MSMSYGECDSCCSLFDDDQLVRFIDDTGNNEFEDRCKSCGPPNWFKSIAAKDTEIASLKANEEWLRSGLRTYEEGFERDRKIIAKLKAENERLREKARAVVAQSHGAGAALWRSIDALRSEVEG